jgi:hypothetical protein
VGRAKVLEKPVRAEEAVDLLIVEDDPAQCFEPPVVALRLEFAGQVREVGQDHARLRELLCAVHQHWHLAHLVDFGAVLRRARLAALEEVDRDRLPVGADQVEHQRRAIGVAGLREAVELVFGHRVPP